MGNRVEEDGSPCECEVCKKWDRVLCGECTLKEFAKLNERLTTLEQLMMHHCYVGVPRDFSQMKHILTLIMDKLGVKP